MKSYKHVISQDQCFFYLFHKLFLVQIYNKCLGNKTHTQSVTIFFSTGKYRYNRTSQIKKPNVADLISLNMQRNSYLLRREAYSNFRGVLREVMMQCCFDHYFKTGETRGTPAVDLFVVPLPFYLIVSTCIYLAWSWASLVV